MRADTIAFETASYPELTYGRHAVPVAVLDGKPWWSTAHIQFFVRQRFRPEDCGVFTEQHFGAHRFPFDAEDEESHVISTLAALEIVGRHPGRRDNKMVGGWLRKRDATFRTAPADPIGTLFRVESSGPYPGKSLYPGPLQNEWVHWSEEFERKFQRPRPSTDMYV